MKVISGKLITLINMFIIFKCNPKPTNNFLYILNITNFLNIILKLEHELLTGYISTRSFTRSNQRRNGNELIYYLACFIAPHNLLLSNILFDYLLPKSPLCTLL